MICMIKIPYMHLYKNNNETLHFVWLYTPIKKVSALLNLILAVCIEKECECLQKECRDD
jgi:hypothetical protein